jgi:diacylglycerol kinase (ATP)
VEATGPVVVVANPTAGRGKGGRLIGRVDATLSEIGVDHEIRVSTSAADLERLAREAGEQGARVVAALGGDGTVGLAANGLLGTGAALAVLPAGTGDDFARAIGARRLDAATRLLADPVIRSIDVIRLTAGAETRHYVCVAGAGFDSEVSETANSMKNGLGATGTYIAAVLKTLPRFVPAAFHLQVDDRSIDVHAMLVVLGNSTSYGGGMKVTPAALLNDGELDICIVGAMKTAAFLRAFPKVFRGSHTNHPKVTMLRGRTVKLEADRRVNVFADGERVGPLPAVFEVLPEALPVVIGPDAKAIR